MRGISLLSSIVRNAIMMYEYAEQLRTGQESDLNEKMQLQIRQAYDAYAEACALTVQQQQAVKMAKKMVVTLPVECVGYLRVATVNKMDILWLLLTGLFYHVVLTAGLIGATRLGMPGWLQGVIMVLDAVCLFYFWWLVGKKSRVQE